ncbi:ABC transporter permease [Halorussus halobius]|uniref:ABC transporter permease n=1 Tax=Halorussus halobius TaxID=1710537 RepID=UPI0010931666|nr:ABC transporter permease [Halorussus halobius]
MNGRALVWKAFAALCYLFLFAPLFAIAIASINPAGLTFPPTGVTAEWYVAAFTDDRLVSAATVSLVVAVATTAVTLPLVVLMGLALRDEDVPGSTAIENFFLAPLSVPQVVLGLALLIYFIEFGVQGTVVGLVLGHLVITLPYALRTVLAALKGFDPSMEEAARNLGASRVETVRYVTLPQIRSALIAGGGFAFIMSLTNFTISVFLVGPGTTTLPIQIYQYITFDIDPAVSAVATVLALASLAVVALIELTFGVEEMSEV